MQKIQTLRRRVSQAFTKLDDKLGLGLADHPERNEVLRTPLLDWTSVPEDRRAQLLRSDELPPLEMWTFRKEQTRFWPEAEKHWQVRDSEISAARAARGLPIVSELAAKNSKWAKMHPTAQVTPQPV